MTDFPPKGRYRHFKGNEYELLDFARHSETGEWMVVYRALYGEGGLWVRPLAMWREAVEWDGVPYPQKPPHRHAEAPGEGHQLLDLRQSPVGFPLINRLPGDPQLTAQGFLGEAQGLPLLCDTLSRGHWQRLLSWAYPAKLPPAFPAIRRRKR